jgi:hypothetical protein
MTAAGVVYGAAIGLETASNSRDGQHIENPLPKLGGWESLAAWGFMFVFLIFLADLGSTGELAKSFAYLFLLAIMFTYGIEAFENLQAMMNQSATGGDSSAGESPPPNYFGPI